MTAGKSGAAGSLPEISDAALVARLVAPHLGEDTRAALEVELVRRAADPAQRRVLQRLLEGYARAAPEYVDEDIQAAARLSLARLISRTHTHR